MVSSDDANSGEGWDHVLVRGMGAVTPASLLRTPNTSRVPSPPPRRRPEECCSRILQDLRLAIAHAGEIHDLLPNANEVHERPPVFHTNFLNIALLDHFPNKY